MVSVPGYGQVLLREPLSVRLGDGDDSGDSTFYAGEVGEPLVKVFASLLLPDAELPSEGSEVGDVRCCNGVDYLAVDFPGDWPPEKIAPPKKAEAKLPGCRAG